MLKGVSGPIWPVKYLPKGGNFACIYLEINEMAPTVFVLYQWETPNNIYGITVM